MFLSRAELEELTGYKLPAYQMRWLQKRGWIFEIGADGKPKVLRSYVEVRMGGPHSENRRKAPRLHLA